ncbi:hypothetical protein ACFPT7_22475 [Acidicapsa dinghuensis]|uniref:Fibronectin type-III domain-containing protein n=1 Tax=Acidicapsa dinghuensis TaxID=2218256 RepID=A0ABW1EP36_9BACT|nr:hypothetical protein [Acidicapsa dinghuensis]
MSDALRLAVMTFPQHWDGTGTLTLNVVLIPSVDPLPGPLIGTTSPSFANGAPTFSVVIDAGLAAEPGPPGTTVLAPTVISAPASPAATFAVLQSAVTASGATLGTVTPLAIPRIRKALPASYFAVGGGPPDGNLTTTLDDFGCGLRGTPPTPLPTTPPKSTTWGQVISYALRQPLLALKLGLIYQLSVKLPAANTLASGGFVYVELAASDPWAVAALTNAGSIRTHAARVPPLTSAPRALFAAIGFPLQTTPPEGPTPSDTNVEIADVYSDGFAKLVHSSQPQNAAAAVGDGQLPPGSDLGIEIGWDDEQVVQWQNDQLALLAARTGGTLNTATQAPLGVLGYRVDVADITPASPGGPFLTPSWQSLCSISTSLPASLGNYTGDLTIEPVAAQPESSTPGDAWLPMYFANWRGGSLCEPDPIPTALTSRSNPVTPARTAAGLTTLLSYGHTYSFRVRLGDLSSGGPLLADAPVNPGPASQANQTFQRLVPPKAPLVTQLASNGSPVTAQPGTPSAPASLVIKRPNIVYPELLYTHLGDEAAWRNTIRTALVTSAKSAAPGSAAVAGLPDPDVAAVSIEVLVRHPQNDTGTDNGPFVSLYTTTRTLNATTGTAPLFTDPGTTIPVVFIDAPSIVDVSAAGQPITGPLLIPRGRDVQITVRGLLRTDPLPYFGSQASQSMATTILVRVEPAGEPELLGQADAAEPITGYLFRRPAGVTAPALVTQLAEELGIVANGNSLTTPPGMRVVFGATLALRTLISADGETLTFGSTAELLRYWVVAIVLDLERDWTWDGLATPAFTILRGSPTDTEATATAVGNVAIPKILGPSATAQPADLARSRTRLIFLDAIDPHEPTSSQFPEALQHRWFVKPNRTTAGPTVPPGTPNFVYTLPPPSLTGTDYADQPLDLTLPIAIPPTQVPGIASVGLALSPYVAGPLYASTTSRQRSLWIELTDPIANQAGDALFARVLSHGADPLLYNATPQAPADSNPPLPLDPELVRVIIPDDTDDRAGITAMTQLTPSSTSDTHFLLPLPPGIDADSPELFGFWTYELRVGHAGQLGQLEWWSTANGRFGSPLRVVGVQHPAPALACRAGRVNIPAASASAVLAAFLAADCPFHVEQVLSPLIPLTTPKTGAPSMIVCTAPYANPTLNGTPLYSPIQPPHTTMWFLLYAQTVQTDGASMRNVLIAIEPGVFVTRTLDTMNAALEPYFNTIIINSLNSTNRIALAAFHQAQIEAILTAIHLPTDSALSVIAVELLPGGTGSDVGNPAGAVVANVSAAVPHLAADLAAVSTPTTTAVTTPTVTTTVTSTAVAPAPVFPFGRILRASPLEAIEPFC